jgi:ribosomal-protein-alanine N-acetyltransferase
MTEVAGPIGVAHAAAMAAIHRMAFPLAETWGSEAIARQLALPGVFGRLDPHGGMILTRIAADEVEVLTLAVIPKVRRQGIGLRLLEAALTHAALRGARIAFLEVAISNVAARGLYERAGFEAAGLRRRYYADGTDALVLRRPLLPPATGPARAAGAWPVV